MKKAIFHPEARAEMRESIEFSARLLGERFLDELLFDQIVHEAIVDGSGGEREILYRSPLTIDSSRALTIRPG